MSNSRLMERYALIVETSGGTEQFVVSRDISGMKRSTLMVYQNSPLNRTKVILPIQFI